MKKKILMLVLTMALCLSVFSAQTCFAFERWQEDGFELYRTSDGRVVLDKYKGPGGDVVVPDGVTTMGFLYNPWMWSDGSNKITSITFPEGFTSVSDWSLSNLPRLEHVTFPDTVTEWGYCMFEDSNLLTEVTVGDTVIPIGGGRTKDYSAFVSEEDKGKDFVLKNALTEYGGQKYFDNALVRYNGPGGNVVIPDGVQYIGRGAFSYRDDITSITIPEGCIYMDYYAFTGCSNLTSVRFPTTLRYTVGYISNTSVLENGVLIEPTIENDPNKKWKTNFEGCYNLRELENFPLPEVAERIEHNWMQYDEWISPGAQISEQSERITTFSNEITTDCANDYEKIMAISKWVSSNIRYDYDYYYGRKSSVIIDPEGVLDSRLTVCDGYTRLTNALIQAQGIPAIYVSGSADNDTGRGWEPHAWTEAYVDGRWVIMDTTWGVFDCGVMSLSFDHYINSRGGYYSENIPSDWAEEYVKEAVAANIVPVSLQNNYTQVATRGEFCALAVQLYETVSGQIVTERVKFNDTTDENVEKAAALGVISGVGGGKAAPDGTLTREQAATMLARLAEVCGKPLSSGDTVFADGGSISGWAASSVNQVGNSGIMSGTGDGNFSPHGQYTREQSITTMLRLFHYINK